MFCDLDGPLNASLGLSVIAEFLVITAQRYAKARSLLSTGVCQSIYVCHVGVFIHTAEHIVKLLSQPVRPIILVFRSQRWYPIPRGTLSAAGAQNTRGDEWENFAIFDWNHHLSRKRYEIGPWLLWNVIENHKWWIDNCRFRWPRVICDSDFKVTTSFNIETTQDRGIVTI